MPTTTNYGWQTPSDTDLVKDGASAIRTLGSSIDSTLKTQIDAQIPDALLTTTGDIIYASGASTPARLGIGTSGQVLQVSSGLPAWATAPTGGMTLIQTITASASATVEFTSIPQTYNNLAIIIRALRPATDNGTLRMRFNSDATASRHQNISWNTANGANPFGSTEVVIADAVDNGANAYTFVQGLIYDYTNTSTWKTMLSLGMSVDGTTPANLYNYKTISAYNQTSAITSLLFAMQSGNITSGSFLLYGVK